MSSKSTVLSIPNWNTSNVKYMAPKLTPVGAKTVNIISTQTNRALTISTPFMMSWGISDYDDNGKFSMSLNFPNEKNSSTDDFLKKLKEFEEQVIDDAVKNSELWFGEVATRDALKYTFFPIVKYSKLKDSKKIDVSKPPSIRAKVPQYDRKWTTEVYDTSHNLLFPCDNALITPVDLVPKLSDVACVLGISQLWFGGKGWGCTLKVVQCVVKPRDVVTIAGKCQIQLSDEDKATVYENVSVKPTQVEVDTLVNDTDDEAEEEQENVKEPMPVPVPVPMPVHVPVPLPMAPPVSVTPVIVSPVVVNTPKVVVRSAPVVVEKPITEVAEKSLPEVAEMEVPAIADVPKVVKKITKKKVV